MPYTNGGERSARAHLVASALRLSQFTIAWNGLIGAVALTVSSLTAASSWPDSRSTLCWTPLRQRSWCGVGASGAIPRVQSGWNGGRWG